METVRGCMLFFTNVLLIGPLSRKFADELKAPIDSQKALFLYPSCDILGLPKSDILSIIFL